MWAMRIQACALAIDLSQSFDMRRQRPSPAKVRSTTHRPQSPGRKRLTIWQVQRPMHSGYPGVWGPHSRRQKTCYSRVTAFRTSGAPSPITVGTPALGIEKLVVSVLNVALAALDLFSGMRH